MYVFEEYLLSCNYMSCNIQIRYHGQLNLDINLTLFKACNNLKRFSGSGSSSSAGFFDEYVCDSSQQDT